MNYCGLKLKSDLFLAPMHEYTNVGFRMLCKKYNAGLCYSEMIHVDSFYRDEEYFLNFPEKEKPVAVQIIGNNLKSIGYTCRVLSEYADVIDINFGCPMEKEAESMCGAVLLNFPKKIEDIVKTAVKSSSVPVSAKIRIAGTVK
ncbi:MAG: tRNA-dihydrouridine synthase family protein, partial [Candidatus Omnitrophica bacterium]|nr:tRNA-dihydrouridine synthase family protein [Candidatus Omnitrophota bacterium]